MKERPILFSAPMVRALLDGSKSQTRRAFSAKMIETMNYAAQAGEVSRFIDQGFMEPNDASYVLDFCPYGQPGDRLWVREAWQHSNFPAGPYDADCDVFYRADYMDDPHGPDGELSPEGKYRTWKPSIHMFRAASRILLEIVSVRVERLQDITLGDICNEGLAKSIYEFRPANDGFRVWTELWESINGAGSWAADPWVWVIEFRRVTP